MTSLEQDASVYPRSPHYASPRTKGGLHDRHPIPATSSSNTRTLGVSPQLYPINTSKINESTQEGVIHSRCNPRSSHSIISPQSDLRKLNPVRQHDPVYIRALSMITLLCVPAQHMSLDVAMPPVAHCPIITLTSSHETPLMFDVRCMLETIWEPFTTVGALFAIEICLG
ncbi:hypothetical protein IG631_22943 [Alternaria alternata]|nr:hypothetical protein IG631_22943 [Alternaria alternata]